VQGTQMVRKSKQLEFLANIFVVIKQRDFITKGT